MQCKRRTIGIRVPMAEIPRRLAEDLGRPLVCTSIRMEDEEGQEVFVIDPVHMETMYGNRLDAVVDGGLGMERPTTVVDLTDVPFEVVREGQGSVELF